MLVLHEKVLVDAVPGKSDGGCAKARQRALEAVESREGAGVSPGLTRSC